LGQQHPWETQWCLVSWLAGQLPRPTAATSINPQTRTPLPYAPRPPVSTWRGPPLCPRARQPGGGRRGL